MGALRDRLRPAVLVREVLLPPVLAGAAVSCMLAALALTITAGSRTGAPNPLARTSSEPLAIGLLRELAVAGPGIEHAELVRARAAAALEQRPARPAAAGRQPSTLAMPVAGVVGGCGTFGCPRSGHLHNGVDFHAAAGTPVYAAASGRVALVQSPGQSGGYGNFVCLQHRAALSTCYAHLSAVAARVRAGAHVRRGQVVGLVGATGSASTPHLHFEVRRGPAGCQECAVDPFELLPRGAGGSRAQTTARDAAARREVTPPPPAAVAPAPGPAAPAPQGAAPGDPTTLVQAEPARPQRIRLPPDLAPERPSGPAAPAPPQVPPAPVPPTDPGAPAAPAAPEAPPG